MRFRETKPAEAARGSNKQQSEISEAVLCSENDSGSGTCGMTSGRGARPPAEPMTGRTVPPRPHHDHHRPIPWPRRPRPSDAPRSPHARPAGRCRPAAWPWPCRETGCGRGPGLASSSSAPPPVLPLAARQPRYAIECGRFRARPRVGKAWKRCARVMCPARGRGGEEEEYAACSKHSGHARPPAG